MLWAMDKWKMLPIAVTSMPDMRIRVEVDANKSFTVQLTQWKWFIRLLVARAWKIPFAHNNHPKGLNGDIPCVFCVECTIYAIELIQFLPDSQNKKIYLSQNSSHAFEKMNGFNTWCGLVEISFAWCILWKFLSLHDLFGFGRILLRTQIYFHFQVTHYLKNSLSL